jgi:hypothetical protein
MRYPHDQSTMRKKVALGARLDGCCDEELWAWEGFITNISWVYRSVHNTEGIRSRLTKKTAAKAYP